MISFGLRALLVISLYTRCIIPATCQISMPAIFGDNMVLQRSLPVDIWGFAKPGERVSIQLSQFDGHAITDFSGEWIISLPPMKAGGPHQMQISGANYALTFQNVMIGEVWICSGQSNMHWPMEQTNDAETEIARANFADLRIYNMSTDIYPVSTAFDSMQLERLRNKDYYQTDGWQESSASTVGPFSAVAYYFGKNLLDSLNVPIGLIHNAIGGSTTESWIDEADLMTDPDLKRFVDPVNPWPDVEGVHKWVKERAKENLAGWASASSYLMKNHPFAPGYLFDTGIKPLIPFAIRGVIWYQGESNATYPELHRKLFFKLVASWRNAWNLGDFPFLYAQLPNFTGRSRWPEMREVQQDILSLPNTAMAVLIDSGNPNDIHPRNKSVVGRRLALQALDKFYDFNLTSEGPILDDYTLEDDGLVTLKFRNGQSLFTSAEPAQSGFFVQGYIEGDTRESILPLNIVRIEGLTIVGRIPDGMLPVKIKYGWMPNPLVNYYNEAGLPMLPFKLELPGNY